MCKVWAGPITLALLLLTLVGEALNQPAAWSALHSQRKRSSSAIDITVDGTLLLAVNPDSNTISLVDTANGTLLTEIPVGRDPRTVSVDDDGHYAYVANRASDSLTIVDLTKHQAIVEIPVGAQPYGVLVSPNGRLLYVTEQGNSRLRILRTGDWQTIRLLRTAPRPSGLAISNDGQTVYMTHLLDNHLSVYDARLPYVYFLPLIGRSPNQAPFVPGLPTEPALGSIRLWSNSNLVQSIVLSPDGARAYVPHSRSNDSNKNLSFDSTILPLVSLVDLESKTHLAGQQLALAVLDPPGVGLPFDAAVTPDGRQLWTLNSASNDITVVDLVDRQLVAHIEVGSNPRGITLAPDGSRAYVNNTLSGTVSVIDASAYAVSETIAVTKIPLPPLLLQGKRLFHSSDDARMSNAQWIACSSCHFDGQHDGRTWFLAFAGPRNTTALNGAIETYPLRWSGEWDESADSEFAIRRENFGSGLIDGSMHCSLFPASCAGLPPNQGRSADLDALAAFIDSLAVPLSPGHRQVQPLSASEQRGRAIFRRPGLGCVDCHPPPLYTDLKAHDVGTITAGEIIGPAYDTPSLRGLSLSAPFFHDGSAATLHDALTRPTPNNEHNLTGRLTYDELLDLIRYLEALPYQAVALEE